MGNPSALIDGINRIYSQEEMEGAESDRKDKSKLSRTFHSRH